MEKHNKRKLVAMIYQRLEKTYTTGTINEVLTGLIAVIKDEVKKGNTVKINNFGTFGRIKYAGRRKRNPNTGELIKTRAHFKPKFKPHEVFNKMINPRIKDAPIRSGAKFV